MSKGHQLSQEDQQFRKVFKRMVAPTSINKSEAPQGADPQEQASRALATELRRLRRFLSKNAESAQKSESLRKRASLPANPASGLFKSHVAIVDQILDGIAKMDQSIAKIKQYGEKFERTGVEARTMLDIATRAIN